jgi:hypothetical protein
MAKMMEASGQSPFAGSDGRRMSMSGKIMDEMRARMR